MTAANTMTRLSVSMLNLSLLVAVTQAHGYTEAGLLMLVYAITNAAAGPVRGRLADRYRPRPVLLALLVVHVAAFVTLCFALAAPMAALVVACLLLGASVPPTGPVVRGLWPVLIPRARLATAYAFDGALNNATFVAGPVLAGALLLVLPVQVAVAVTGLVKVTGDGLVATAPEVRDMPVHERQAAAGLLGPLVHGRVRLLLTLMALDVFTYGCLEIAAVAAASGRGSAGVLTGLLALGAVVGGLAYGARTWPGTAGSLLVALTCAGVVLLTVGAGVGAMVATAAVFVAYGLVNSPVETVKQVLIGEDTPEHQRVEVFSWVFSVMWLGFGLGTTVAGAVTSAGETGPALLAATVAQLVAVALTVARLRDARLVAQ